MKWFSVLLLSALAILSNACEMHPASELTPEEVVPGELPAEVKAEAKPAEAAPAPATDAKPGEAPKFFPDKK